MTFKRRKFLALAGLSVLGSGFVSYVADFKANETKINSSPETLAARNNTQLEDLGPLQLRFIATADTGAGDKNQFAVGRAMEDYRKRSPFDLVVMGGDNIYNSGEISKIKIAFEEPYADLLKAGVKFRACLGNHDIRTDNGNPQVKYAGFNMDGRYYTYRQGPAQFFALDLNSNVKWDDQIDWLQKELKKSKATWKIVYSHFPIYSSGHYGTNPKMVELFTPMFKEHRVNLYINGHEHHYERSRPLDGTTYLVTGHGGASLRPVKSTGISAFAVSRFGFSSIEFYEKAMVIQGIGTDGKVFDRGVIKV